MLQKSLLIKNLQFSSDFYENLGYCRKHIDNFFIFYKKIDTQNFGDNFVKILRFLKILTKNFVQKFQTEIEA